jgi:hypothetical protein
MFVYTFYCKGVCRWFNSFKNGQENSMQYGDSFGKNSIYHEKMSDIALHKNLVMLTQNFQNFGFDPFFTD